MKIPALLAVLLLTTPLFAQEAADPPEASAFDAGRFIRQTHLHQWFGYSTMTLAVATGTAGALGWEYHPVLGYSTIASGALTLSLGLTAYADRLDQVWPHAALMGLAETGWLLNAFVWEPGSLPHKITGVTSIVSLGAAFVAIKLIQAEERAP